MKKNSDVLPLLYSPIDGWDEYKKLGISNLDSKVLHVLGGRLVVLLIGAADFNFNNAA